MIVKLLAHTENPDKLIASAAKLCYSSSTIDELMEKIENSDIDKFIETLHDMGHESPFEHASFTFAIEGVSRITEQQLTRHRIASYSIQSGRYTNRSNGKLRLPPVIENNSLARFKFDRAMDMCLETYREVVALLIDDYIELELSKHSNMGLIKELIGMVPDHDRGIKFAQMLKKYMPDKYQTMSRKVEKKAFEDARYILPNGIQTTIIMTMNVRELFHFLKLRHCKRAQWEIREVATKILEICREVSPVLFKYAGAPCTRGQCTEGKMSCGEPYQVM
jgi:thymidylate synthase (FAD)